MAANHKTMFDSIHHWLDRKLKIDAYELHGDEIVSGGLIKRRIRFHNIRTWREIYIGGGSPSICIECIDGRTIDWSDKREQLFHILRKVAADKEQPLFTA